MAIYHFSAQIISRAKGRCSVAAAAYRSGKKLNDERTGLGFDYTRKTGIKHTEILTPPSAPAWASDREKLWNEVEKIEKRKDAQLAREVNIALPRELKIEQQIELTREFVKDNFINKGMIADISIHNADNKNPHVHIMLTTREVCEDGFGKKNREWNNKEHLEQWREQWAKCVNRNLEKANIKDRIDHRSLEEQGIDRIPQIHVGVHANAREKKGFETERGNLNREIKDFNTKLVELRQYKEQKAQIENEKARYNYLDPEETQMVLKAESILGEQQSYENSDRYMEQLSKERINQVRKYNELDNKGKELGTKISNIKFDLENISKCEKNLKELPKGLFGYKDKPMAKTIKNNINYYKNMLDQEGYKDSSDISNYQVELDRIVSDKELISRGISDIDNRASTINNGVKALKNKEVREFIDGYKGQFKQAEYLKYEDVAAIKEASKNFNKQLNAKEIKSNYFKDLKSLKELHSKIRDVKDLEHKISTAKRAFETVEKYEDVAYKYQHKLFGREKYQTEHQSEYERCDQARKMLYDIKIQSREELSSQEELLNSLNKDQLIKGKEQVQKEVDILRPAFEAIENAERREELQKKKEMEKESNYREERRRYKDFER